MLSPLALFAALALICLATAFPLSDLLVATPADTSSVATQLLSLRDGTYLALISSDAPLAQGALNPGVRTVRFESQNFPGVPILINIVARVRPTNNSVIWAYATDGFSSPAYAVVDDARSIFVVGDSSFTSLDFGNSFRVLRFSVDGEIIWKELYTDNELGRPTENSLSIDSSAVVPNVDLAGRRTLAILGEARSASFLTRRSAVFVDTITRKARVARFPLPDGLFENVALSAVAADPVSGAACFADITSGLFDPGMGRLFVQCANAEGGGEVVSRVLVPFQSNTFWTSLNMIMAGGGEGKAAALYVVALSSSPFDDASVDSNRFADAEEMLLFKLNPTTLQDMEWESGLTSMKPTMRKLLLTASFSGSAVGVISLEYIRDQNILVVLYGSLTILHGIETLADGTIAFRGNSSMAAERSAERQWLLYFGNDSEPTAARIPDDPRPDGEQDEFDFLRVADLELTENRRGLYLFGGFRFSRTFDLRRYGELVTVPFSIPAFAQPGSESPEMEDDLENGVEESFEPSPDETAEAVMDEEVEPSPNALQEQDT